MNTKLSATLVAVSILAGCAAETGVDRAGKASASMTEFSNNIKGGQKQVDAVVVAMNGLTAAKDDLKPAFDKYLAELDRTESYAANLRADADEVKEKGRAYFKKWEEELAQIKDEELRNKAKARAEERSKEYSQIEVVIGTAKGKWASLSTALKDVKQYLSNDLTQKGVSSLSGTFTKANLDATDLKKALAEIATVVDKVAADFAGKAATK
jgi:chromosome segregation ATPase